MSPHTPLREKVRRGLHLLAASAMAVCAMWLLNLLLGEAPSTGDTGAATTSPESVRPMRLPAPPLAAQREA